MACWPEPLRNSRVSAPHRGDVSGRLDLALRQESAQWLAAFQQILGFRTVQGRTVERRFDDFFIRQRNVEARAEFAQLFLVQLLLLVRDVAAFAGFAQAVAFDGLGQDDGRGPLCSMAAL